MGCIWAWALIIPGSLHFAAVIFSFKVVASFSLGDCVELAFLVEALQLTLFEDIKQRNTEETVETVTLVSAEDCFILETLS